MIAGGDAGGDAGDDSSQSDDDDSEVQALKQTLAAKELIVSMKKKAKAKAKAKQDKEKAKKAKAKAKQEEEKAAAEAGVKDAESGAKKKMAWWNEDRCVGKDQSTVRAGACGGCVRVRACLSCE